MRGYCPRCREYRSDNGGDAWTIVWKDDLPFCQRCKSLIDIWPNSNRGVSSKPSERKKSHRRGWRTIRVSVIPFSHSKRRPFPRIQPRLGGEGSMSNDTPSADYLKWHKWAYEQRYGEGSCDKGAKGNRQIQRAFRKASSNTCPRSGSSGMRRER